MAFLYDVSKLFRRVAFGYSYVYDPSLNGGWGGHKWATTTTPYKTTIVTYENGSEAIRYATANSSAVQLKKLTHTHSYKSSVTKAATCNAKGTMTYTCSDCGDSYTSDIAATGHTFKNTLGYVTEIKAPTPAATGVTRYICVNCKGTLTDGTKDETTSKRNIRIAGNNRFETSAAIANEFFTSPSAITLAYGNNFPDGLCGGLLSFSANCPMILTAAGRTDATKSYAASKNVTNAWILGGTTLVSDADVTNILKK